MAKIYSGDTSDIWEIGFRDLDALVPLDGNFTCWIGVKGYEGFAVREVTEKNEDETRFRAWLTPAETAALGAGTWTVGIELRNPTLSPPLVKEVQRVVRIEAGAVEE